jgi:SAM-dependent methyltransferase
MRDEIRQMWRKLGRKKRAAWPRVEQGQYRSYRAVHPFDERFGVETSGLIYELPSGHAHDVYNNGYFAVAPSVFHAVMRLMRERLHLEYQRFRFVDVGSGKGRALLLASDYPFREVIGVELSPELDRVARANVARYAAVIAAEPHAHGNLLHRPPVISIQGDATEFLWPPGPLVVYMWNAFTSPVMERVFHNLRASLAEQPRELYLVYMHPELESMLASLPWLTMLWRDEIAMSDEDYGAWAFPTRDEICAVYRAIPSPATAGVASAIHTKV